MLLQHLYKTFLYKIDDKVAGLPEDNSVNLTEFETDFKSQAESYTEVELGTAVLIHDVSYTDFKALISNWAVVWYKETDVSYELIYLTEETI